MITRVEALRFRCLAYIEQDLENFQVLVGPNASGKTSFLEVIAFLGRMVSIGLERAIDESTSNFQDLVWKRSTTDSFQLAIEARIPSDLRELLEDKSFDLIRYEVEVGPLPIGNNMFSDEVGIISEKVCLIDSQKFVRRDRRQRMLFPEGFEAPSTLLTPRQTKGSRSVINKTFNGSDYFKAETGKGWEPSFKLGPKKSALGNLPEDESRFPVATWLKLLLAEGVQYFVLNSLQIRKASGPGQSRRFNPDGSNLPWMIDYLFQKHEKLFEEWIAHVQTALPNIKSVRTIERHDDRHRFLVVEYQGGLEVPSWLVSDGTLRLLALTLPAYLPDFKGIYLIEEPENGIHPRAVEAIFQSLSSVYSAQMLVATHSPIFLGVSQPKDILCFSKTSEGATDIVAGNEHPRLKNWRAETPIATLFAAGVLG